MIKLVSWDVDGTLFSYARLFQALIALGPRKLRRIGLSALAREVREVWDFHAIVESQRRTVFSRVDESQMKSFAVANANEREALQAALQRIRPRQAVIPLLAKFKRLGIPQVALSDFECEYKLKALGTDCYFAATYSCREMGYWKPSAIVLRRLQEDFAIQPSEHLHIGDRPDTDGEACARNGARFLLIDSSPKLWRPLGSLLQLYWNHL
jgi:FMN phosphatase YigB (HAD superfamily)